MNALGHAVIHHVKRIAEQAGATWSADCTAELESLFAGEDDRIKRLETGFRDLSTRVEHLERHIRPEVV